MAGWEIHLRMVGYPSIFRRFAFYAFCNPPADTSWERLAERKCVRAYIERANQDAKSELGWADLRAQKYLSWQYHTALTILAAWFIASTKLEWGQECPPSPILGSLLEIDQAPNLSMSNIRELLRAVMPLPQLTLKQATEVVPVVSISEWFDKKDREREVDLRTSLSFQFQNGSIKRG